MEDATANLEGNPAVDYLSIQSESEGGGGG